MIEIYQLISIYLNTQYKIDLLKQDYLYLRMETEYQVEEILEERITQSNDKLITQYKVKWRGYALKDATWEPLQNLEGCLQKLRDFQQRSKQDTIPLTPQKKGSKKIVKQKKKTKNVRQVKKTAPILSRNQFYFSDQSDEQIILDQRRTPNPILEKSFSNFSQPSPVSPVEYSKSQKVTIVKKKQIKPYIQKPFIQKKPNSYQKMNDQFSESDVDYRKQWIQAQLNKPIKPLVPYITTQYVKPKQKRSYYLKTPAAYVTNKSTQTHEQINFNPNLTILSLVYCPYQQNQIVFNVKLLQQQFQLSRQQMLINHPLTLYNYYHQHYLQVKDKYLEVRKLLSQIIEGEKNMDQLDQIPYNQLYSYKYMQQIKGGTRPLTINQWRNEVKDQLNKLMKSPQKPPIILTEEPIQQQVQPPLVTSQKLLRESQLQQDSYSSIQSSIVDSFHEDYTIFNDSL